MAKFRNFQNDSNKDFLDYNYFLKNVTKICGNKDVTFAELISKSKEINAQCLNKNFFYILAWEWWISETNTEKTVKTYIDNGESTNAKGEKVLKYLSFIPESFGDFHLYPWSPNGKNLLPVPQIQTLMQFLRLSDKSIEKLKQIYTTIDKGLTETGSTGGRIDLYINANQDKMGEANDGLYINILDAIGITPSPYLINKNNTKELDGIKKISIKSFTDKNENIIHNNIKELRSKDFGSLKTKDDFYRQELLITTTAKKIIMLIQSMLYMVQELYNMFIKTEGINLTDQVELPSSGALSIEDSLMLSRPPIEPIFKKSYVVRENNLKPFLTIKMIYYAGQSDYVTVNNFQIPYNNILTMEHNVKEYTMTITLIDTEGALGELLIQKLYAISQKRTNVRKTIDTNASPEKPYFFIVEYGWSGPDSEDEDELLEEGVFTKCTNRGFIKSVSSQFSFKGNEYTLTITPNDQENINKYLNNHDMFYFPAADKEVSTVTGLMALFLILFDPNVDAITDLQDLFQIIETNCYLCAKRRDASGYDLYFSSDKEGEKLLNKEKESLNINKNKEIDEIVTAMLGLSPNTLAKIDENDTNFSVVRKNKGTSFASKHLSQIKFNNENGIFDRLSKACDAGNFSLNGWLTGVYLIWKMKKYFLSKGGSNQFFLFDTTGLFDVFDKDGNVETFSPLGECKGVNFVLEKFNPFCWSPDKAKLKFGYLAPDSKDILTAISEDIKNNKNDNNQYDLKNLIDVEPQSEGSLDETVKRQLTLFTAQIASVFTTIEHTGMGTQTDQYNIYHGASGVFADFNALETSVNDLELIKQEYKRRVYSDRNNIFYDGKDENDAKIRHQTFFEEKIKKIFDEIDDANNEATSDPDSIFSKGDSRNDKIRKNNQQRRAAKQRLQYLESRIEGQKGDNKDKTEKEISQEKENIQTAKENSKKYENKINILYLAYKTDPNKVAFLNCDLSRKVSILGKQLVQSYSFTPRIASKTRNNNKQFFSQGNKYIVNEGTGDIIEFSLDPIDIGNFNSLMLSNKNKNNIGFNDLSSNSFAPHIYDNAAKYYRTYRDIDGNINKKSIAKDIARLDMNYQSQTNLKGSITIIGEPYWSNINLMFSKCIFIHVYYANGERSSHSGLYYVSNATQNISEGKFTTKLEIIRAPTFLSSLEKLANKGTYLS